MCFLFNCMCASLMYLLICMSHWDYQIVLLAHVYRYSKPHDGVSQQQKTKNHKRKRQNWKGRCCGHCGFIPQSSLRSGLESRTQAETAETETVRRASEQTISPRAAYVKKCAVSLVIIVMLMLVRGERLRWGRTYDAGIVAEAKDLIHEGGQVTVANAANGKSAFHVPQGKGARMGTYLTVLALSSFAMRMWRFFKPTSSLGAVIDQPEAW